MRHLYPPLKKHLFLAAFCLSLLPVLAQPSISSFTPQSGPPGTTVTITGTGFHPFRDSNIVYFGATKASVQSATSTSLSVLAPYGATYKPVTVTVNRRTAYSDKPFITTFAGGGVALSGGSFAPKIDFAAQSNPREIAIADLNRDGRSDLFVTNQASNTASVFRNTGNPGQISFSTPRTIGLGSAPFAVTTGDFDGDGLTDIAVTNNNNGNSGSISVLRNASFGDSIFFSSRTDIPAGMGPLGIVASDLNKDGKPDLLVSSSNSDLVSIFKNTTTSTGAITFARMDISGTGHPGELSVADLDGDGMPDLASANFNNSISIWRNMSIGDSIAFATRVNITGDTYPNGIAIGDIDKDGKPDMVVANYSSPSVAVFKNISNPGSFLFTKYNFPVGTNTRSVSIADVNGDDQPDIAVTTDSPAVVSVLRNTSIAGNISFDNRVDYIAGTSPTDVAIGDLDNDGKADLAVTNSYSYVSVLRNRLNEPVVRSFSPATGAAGTKVTIIGERFTGAGFVSFGGVPADSVTVLSDTVVQAVVTYGASGNVAVTTPYGTGSKAGFVYAAPPQIYYFTPTAALPGNTVSIIGRNFSTVSSVYFGDSLARSITIVADTLIRAVVGGGTSGNIIVNTSFGSDTIAGFTFVPPAILLSFAPTSGATGDTITLYGRNFTGVSIVRFGGIVADSFTLVSDSVILAYVGSGASGMITVTKMGSSSNRPGFIFEGPPVVGNFNPKTATPGTWISIFGMNLLGATDVRFGGIAADSIVESPSGSLNVLVGNAASGSVSVTTPYGASSLSGFTFINKPLITSISPSAAPVGSTVTITGKYFGDTASRIIAYFGAVRALVLTASDTMLTLKVPAGATYDPVSIIVNGLAAYTNRSFTVTFPGAGNSFSAASFASKIDSATATSPVRLAAADLDGDGRVDVVALSSSYLSVHRNTGAAGKVSFAPYIAVSIPVGGLSFRIADIDRDGKLDIVVINNSTAISVCWNTSTPGNINFSTRQFLPSGNTPTDVAIGDLDLDGRPDIVVTNAVDKTISVYRNLSSPGTSGFAGRLIFPVGSMNPRSISIDDFDGDGKPDVAVGAYAATDSIFILKNTGRTGVIAFAASTAFAAQRLPWHLNTGDLDADGLPDLTAANRMANSISLYRNTSATGILSFGFNQEYAADSMPLYVAIGDLDGDGKPDLASAGSTGHMAGVFKNNSTPGTIAVAGKVNYVSGIDPSAVVIADMNNDGKPELITANRSSNSISVLRNRLGEASITSFSPTAATSGTTVTIIGANFTGASDVRFGGVAAASFIVLSDTVITAVVGNGASGDVTVTTQSGTASLTGFIYVLTPSPVITSVTPANGPAGTVATISGQHFANDSVSNIVYFGAVQATVTAATDTSITAIVPAASTWQPVTVTANRLTGSYQSPFNVTFNGTGFNTTSFNNKISYTTGSYPRNVALGDLNGDGRSDLAVVNNNSNTLSVFINATTTDSITLASRIDYGTGNLPFNVAIDDLDGDGRKDIVVADYNVNTISVYKNIGSNGSVGFAPRVTYSTGQNPIYISIGDLDADGKPEIVVVNNNSYTVSVFRNSSANGVISFYPGVQYAVGNWPWACSISDLNGDAKPDLVVSNYYGNSISVLKNTGGNGFLSFAAKVDYATGNYPSHVFAGDIDGDGKPDIVVPNSDSQTFSIFRNISDTTIVLAPRMDLSAGSIPLYVSMGNLDGDGKPDLCVVNFGSNTISVFKNNSSAGTISLGPKVDYATEMSPRNVMIGDLNGDAKPELAFINSNSNSLSILRNRVGDSTFLLMSTIASGNAREGQDRMEASLAVFPNPARNFTLVKHPVSSSAAQIQIIDITGRVIRTQNLGRNASQTRLDIQGLAHGAYKLLWLDGIRMMSETLLVQ